MLGRVEESIGILERSPRWCTPQPLGSGVPDPAINGSGVALGRTTLV